MQIWRYPITPNPSFFSLKKGMAVLYNKDRSNRKENG